MKKWFILLVAISSLVLAQETVQTTLNGTVKTVSSRPVANANLEFIQNGKTVASTVSDANGQYNLAIKPGEYQVYANGELVQSVSVAPGQTTTTANFVVAEYVGKMVGLDLLGIETGVQVSSTSYYIAQGILITGIAAATTGTVIAINEANDDDGTDSVSNVDEPLSP